MALSGLSQCSEFPTIAEINDTVVAWHKGSWTGPKFKGQSTFSDAEHRYYEQIVSDDGCVPTRENSWHDLFNALIWMQFPQTKAYLNALHVDDIQTYGLTPRTKRRNHITHFDECGVVLAVPQNQLEAGNQLLLHLGEHQWIEGFYHQKHQWNTSLFPFVFGHAVLEMMLNPFIGLTAKWLAVVVADNFSRLSFQQQCEELDHRLVKRIKHLDDLTPRHILKPLPVLGVPEWSKTQTLTFYENEEYFRPKRANTQPSLQLPLT